MYQINEGRFVVPDGFEDSSNTVLKWSDGRGTLSLTVVRDSLQQDENLDDYIKRQLVILKENLKGYRLHQQQEVLLGKGEKAIRGVQLTSQYYSNKTAIHQQQAGFITKGQVLIFTITRDAPFDESMERWWDALLLSFEPHQ